MVIIKFGCIQRTRKNDVRHRVGSVHRNSYDVRHRVGIIMEIFGDYIPTFMQVFLDDFVVYNRKEEHLDHLQMCLKKCWGSRLSLNPVKCVFEVTSRALLEHIVNKNG